MLVLRKYQCRIYWYGFQGEAISVNNKVYCSELVLLNLVLIGDTLEEAGE